MVELLNGIVEKNVSIM